MEETANRETWRAYLFFWSGQLFSVLGSSISQFTIILWLTEITGSALLLSFASFFYALPMTIVITFAGVLIDRWSRKKIILVVDSLQAFIMVLIILLFSFDLAEPLIIIAINGLLGLFQGFHIPTVNAIIPTMVPKERLSRINGLNFFFTGSIQIIGPIIAAMLMSFMPIMMILWLDPLTYAIAFIPLLLTNIPIIKTDVTSIQKKSFLEDFKIGFRALKLIPILLMMLLVAMFVNFLLRPFGIFMPYLILFNHSGTPTDLAIVLAFLNGGTLLGALVTSIKKNWKHIIPIYFCGEMLLMVTYGIIGASPHGFFLLMSISAAIFGFIVPINNTIYLTIMQQKVPKEKMGRISSIDWAISLAISPIGALISGPLAEFFGVPSLFVGCSIIGVVITLTLWWIAHTRVNSHNIENEGISREINNIKI
ncbi:MAG: MFS transporter [Candidatus Hodarchaeota archaeon]